MTIKILKVVYNRNGISGEPFYSVKFNLKEDGESRTLFAVVTERESYIIEPTDLDSKWRGDRIGIDLRKSKNINFK